MAFNLVSKALSLLANTSLRISARTGVNPSQEAVYQAIFDREIHSLGLTNNYCAVGAAANYSLLYALLRALREFSFQQIVELGAGQSTLLLDQIASAQDTNTNILTIESDPYWRDAVQAKVKHEVRLVGLEEQTLGNYRFKGYSLANAVSPNSIDFLIIDGPPAGRRDVKFARLAALQLVPLLNPNGFLVIVDDAERSGEDILCQQLENAINARGISCQIGRITAAKQQRIFAHGRLSGAAFY